MVGLNQFGSLDAILIGVILIGVLVGYFQGVVRQAFLLAAIYFGMVLAAQYYTVAAAGVAMLVPGGDGRSYSTVGLLLVFVVGVLSINAVGYLTYRSTRLPTLHAVDQASGALLGIVSAWLFLSLSLSAADFALAIPLGGLEWAQHGASQMISSSALAPLVHNSMPMLYETLRPWVPSGLPAPFAA